MLESKFEENESREREGITGGWPKDRTSQDDTSQDDNGGKTFGLSSAYL